MMGRTIEICAVYTLIHKWDHNRWKHQVIIEILGSFLIIADKGGIEAITWFQVDMAIKSLGIIVTHNGEAG
jgi:hypothetical protein